MSTFFKRLLLILLYKCISFSPGLSQDNNFWTQQYGNVSTFLGGAVVGSYKDNGSIYYNPATLAFTDTIKISFSAALYQTNLTRVSNATSNDSTQSLWGFKSFPISFYPVVRLSNKSRLGFIYLLRNYSSFRLHDYKNELMDVTGNGTKQDFIGSFDNQNTLTENWYGASFSHIIGPKSSVGISLYGIYRYQSIYDNYSANVILDASKQEYLITNISHYLDYDLYQGIAKAGYFHEYKQFSIGCVVTFPSFYVLSYSRSSSQFYFSGWQPYLPGDSINELLVFNEQRNNKVNYKYPASLSIGIKQKFDKLILYVTTELYAPVKEYNVLNLSDSGNATLPADFEKANQMLLNSQLASRTFMNLAVGFEFKLKQTKSIVAGFCTDLNALPKSFQPEGFNVSTARNNLYHASAGMDVHIKKLKINGGLKFSYGYSRDQLQFVNMSTASTDNLLIGNRQYNSDYNYFAFNLFIGLNF